MYLIKYKNRSTELPAFHTPRGACYPRIRSNQWRSQVFWLPKLIITKAGPNRKYEL